MFRKYIVYLSLIVLTLSYATCSKAQEIPAEHIEEVHLANGMTFLLMPHGDMPIFSAYIRVRVGGLDEPEGTTGISHLIEHMAFKGTQTWGTKNWPEEKKILAQIEEVGQRISQLQVKGETETSEYKQLRVQLKELYAKHDQYTIPEAVPREYQRRGGLHLNATTSQDLTTYFVSLPSSELKFWAELESERLFSPVFREFYLEKDVVLEERRLRLVDSPAGAFYTQFITEAFKNTPYGRPTIGYEKDLLSLTRTQTEAFFNEYYRPDKIVGALVGRFDVAEAKRLVQETFGKIPAATQDPPPEPIEGLYPPLSRHECRLDLERPAQARLAVGFFKPNMPSPDDLVFDVIATILTEGRSSRLYRSMVIEKQLATSVQAYASVPGSRLPNLFMVFAMPRPGVPLDRLNAEIMNELKQLATNEVTSDELAKAKKQLRAGQIWRLEDNDAWAEDLTYYQSLLGDWHYLVNYGANISRVDKAAIQRVAQTYFTTPNRCLGFLHDTTQ